MTRFKTLYNAGATKRWHTQLILKEQDLAAHQWGVAMICRELLPGNAKLLEAALTHDLGEAETGDIPYTAKRDHPHLKEESENIEKAFSMVFNTRSDLNPLEQACLRWADMFECYLFVKREIGMGNQLIQPVMGTVMVELKKLGAPNAKAAQLFTEYHG